jgi:hypothetical protein
MMRPAACLEAGTPKLRRVAWTSFKGNGAHGVMSSKSMNRDEGQKKPEKALTDWSIRATMDWYLLSGSKDALEHMNTAPIFDKGARAQSAKWEGARLLKESEHRDEHWNSP